MPDKIIEIKSCTLASPGRLNRLPTECLVLSKMRNSSESLQPKLWQGIWDTGATGSCITQRIVEDLQLIPIGKSQISTANGLKTVNTYLVDIGLPNNVIISNVVVSCADLGKDLDLLIGMDIIGLGDFAITNVNGRTTFSFRLPSICVIDFNNTQEPYKQLIK